MGLDPGEGGQAGEVHVLRRQDDGGARFDAIVSLGRAADRFEVGWLAFRARA